MTAAFADQRPRFEQLVEQISAAQLEPFGFSKGAGRSWTRPASADVQHAVTWEKTRPTSSTAVLFVVESSATWVTGPRVGTGADVAPRVSWRRLTLAADDPAADALVQVRSARDAEHEVWKLTAESDLDLLGSALGRALAEQARSRLDDITDTAACLRALRTPDASIPGSQTLLAYYASVGDRISAQEQYWRLRRHFGHRNFPRDDALRSIVADLQLSEPPG